MRRFTRAAVVAVWAVGLWALGSTPAPAATISAGFEGDGEGFYSKPYNSAAGFQFTTNLSTFTVEYANSASHTPIYNNNRWLSGGNYVGGGAFDLAANFSLTGTLTTQRANQVTLDLPVILPVGASNNTLTLTAFDVANNVVGVDTETVSSATFAQAQLSVASAAFDIHHFTIMPGDVRVGYDNIVANVPEASAAALLTLPVLAALRRRGRGVCRA